jgi:predicted RNA methylase
VIEGVELEVLEGLVPFVQDELARVGLTAGSASVGGDERSVWFTVADPRARWRDLLGVRTAVAAYAVLGFAVSRPRGLLSPEHTRRITTTIDEIRRLHPKGSFRGFRFSAAGHESEEFERLATAIAAATGLAHDQEAGELLVRVRRARLGHGGWEVLLRLSPRPLSARAWRAVNYPGAVNATIAAALVELTEPAPDDRFVNLCCGSGTILVERLARGVPAQAVGCDLDPDAVAATQANLRAARLKGRVDLWTADATALADRAGPASFDKLCVDLPWGTLVGSHDDNATLYPRVLAEAARIATGTARLVVLTHEIRLFERVRRAEGSWRIDDEIRVFQKGHHPRIYLLARA